MIASARGQQETGRLGKVDVDSGPWLKVGPGRRLEGGAGDGVELLHQPFQAGHLLGEVVLFIHLENQRKVHSAATCTEPALYRHS